MSERDDELDREPLQIVDMPVDAEPVDADGVADVAQVESKAATDALHDLVLFLVRNLVDDPGAVEVGIQQRGSLVQIQLRLPEEELGKVIGRGGRIAKSMRTALMIAGSRHHLRVSLDIEG